MIERTAKNGHKIVEVSHLEAHILRWGNICDKCNAPLIAERFYIPVLNYGVCGECSSIWGNTASFFKEDIPFEQSAINVLKTIGLNYEVEGRDNYESI
ncbi:hypothetical protein [Erysipelothrix aquatica]|uniref:hypothetical protein n=1 Tax=Erysipelothrix aquatica TaxID=2683714 RepID=UPI0013574E2C|nr:hypothetical protein [Erysipelothrix aquatica]